VRSKALEAAEIDVLERRIVTIPRRIGSGFEAWATKAAYKIAGLDELVPRSPTWRK